jgi:hypothetical protein
MGAKEGKLKEQFLYAIVANKEGEVVNFLKVIFHPLLTISHFILGISNLCEHRFSRRHNKSLMPCILPGLLKYSSLTTFSWG